MNKQYMEELLIGLEKKWSDKKCLNEKIIKVLIILAKNDLNVIKNIINAISKKEEFTSSYINVKIIDDIVNVWNDTANFEFNKNDFREFCINLINICEPILPLGSIITLETDDDENKDSKFIISKRMLTNNNTNIYIPYALVPYPLGIIDGVNELYIDSSFIKNVIFKGFSDELNDTFIYINLQSLVIENHKVSFGYASKKQISELITPISGTENE